MNEQLQNDVTQIGFLFEKVKKQSVEYLKNIQIRPTATQNTISNQIKLPNVGIGTAETLQLFNDRFEPMMVSSSGPRYWGFVTGGSTPASILGDWLTSIYDQNPQAIKGEADVSAFIEVETIALLLDFFQLPNDFFGGFVTGATMSNFTCLAVARQWIGKELGKDFAKDGFSENIHILTASPHSSILKSLAMLGIGSNHYIKVNTLEGNREAIDMDALENCIKELKGQPFILISSGGTVNSVDFDDFEAINQLKSKYNFWWHIDAAFGGFAACSEKYKYLLNGWENADSITIDCHKWMNVPYDSAIFLVKEKYSILQMETFQNSNAPYLGNPMDNFNYLNFLPENSRRLRALPVWFSLMAYGKQGYSYIVENCIDLAKKLGEFVEKSNKFQLLAPVRLNTVCFTLLGEEKQEKIQSFLNQLNKSGQVFMTPTVYKGKKGIRAAFVNWQTNTEDIAIVIELMNKIIEN